MEEENEITQENETEETTESVEQVDYTESFTEIKQIQSNMYDTMFMSLVLVCALFITLLMRGGEKV